MATSDPSLPPEMVEAIERAYGGDEGDTTPARIAAALAPLLAERDAEKDAAIARLQAGYRSLDADWGRSQAEARRLREATERAYERLTQGAPDAVRATFDAARLLYAALSASPDPDPCSDCDGTGIGGHGGTAPVSVPEQEEGRAFLARHGALDDTLVAADPALAAVSSSSSEEGERAVHYSVDAGDGITALVYGAPNPSPESADAIRAVIRAAAEELSAADHVVLNSPGSDAAQARFIAAGNSIRATFGGLRLGFDLDDAVEYLEATRETIDLDDASWARLCGAFAMFATVCVEQDRTRLRERLTSDEAARTLLSLLERPVDVRYGVNWNARARSYEVFTMAPGPARGELVEAGLTSLGDARGWVEVAETRQRLASLAAALLNDTKETGA